MHAHSLSEKTGKLTTFVRRFLWRLGSDGVVQTVSKAMVLLTVCSLHRTADGDIREGRCQKLCSHAPYFAGREYDMERE